jgi:tetratricopeptide (TPR) repeat protein
MHHAKMSSGIRRKTVLTLFLEFSFVIQITNSSALLNFCSKSVLNAFIAPLLMTSFEVPQVNIPTAITTLHPLPQEELVTSYNRGNSYLVMGQFGDALVEFNKAAELAPDSADVYLSRGIVEEKLFQWDAAIADYNKANSILKKRPFSGDDPTVISNIANAETGLLQWENALRDFTKAAQLKSDFLAPQIGRALVLYQLDRPEETFQYFKTLAVKYPYFPDGQAVLAAIYFEKGDLKSANDCWENALEEDSRYEDIDWVLNIRRWPPKLVETLAKFKDQFSASISNPST